MGGEGRWVARFAPVLEAGHWGHLLSLLAAESPRAGPVLALLVL
jgi:hypothetical protein